MITVPLRVAVFTQLALREAGLTRLILSGGDRARVVCSATPPVHGVDLNGADVAIYDLEALVDDDCRDDIYDLRQRLPVVALAPGSREDAMQSAHALGASEVVGSDVRAADLLDVLEQAARRPTRAMRKAGAQMLSAQERLILSRVGAGLTNQQIAQELNLSINSVKTYIRGAYRKIGVSTRPHAVIWVIRHGLLPRTD